MCEHFDSETPMIDNRNSFETVLVFTMLCLTYLSYTSVGLHRAVERPTHTCGILLGEASSDLLTHVEILALASSDLLI